MLTTTSALARYDRMMAQPGERSKLSISCGVDNCGIFATVGFRLLEASSAYYVKAAWEPNTNSKTVCRTALVPVGKKRRSRQGLFFDRSGLDRIFAFGRFRLSRRPAVDA